MAFDIQQTSSQIEGCTNDINGFDLSRFKEVRTGLKRLKMFELYFPVFAQNNVDDEAIVCLEKDDLIALIGPVGDRARFIKWLQSYKNKGNDPNYIITSKGHAHKYHCHCLLFTK
eukprot:502132_1